MLILDRIYSINLGVDYPKEGIELARGIKEYSLSIVLFIIYERESRV